MTWADSDDAQRYGAGLLRGERVRLRDLHDSDLPTLAAWWNDPEWAVLQQGRVKPRPERALSDMIRMWSENGASSADVGFSIVLHDGTLIGHATLHTTTPVGRAAEFAILIGPEHTGSGLGTEAARLVVGYGFRELGLNRIGLSVWAYNTRAQRAYSKAGFREEGRKREIVFHDGRFHDEVLMSILRSEFSAGQPSEQPAEQPSGRP